MNYHYHIWKLIPDEEIILKSFLYKYLQWDSEKIKAEHGVGTTMVHVTKGSMEARDVPIPPLEEQKQIVAILDKAFAAIDQAKANVEKNLQNAKELFQSKLNAIFSQQGEDWEEKKLGDVCYNVEYGTSKKSSNLGEIPVIRMGNVQDGEIVWDDLVYSNDKEDIIKYSLKEGDVLFNRTNSAELVGKSAIYKGERPAIFAGYLIRINRIPQLLNGAYLNYYLNSSKTRKYGFSVMTSSVNQANINGTKLKEYIIPIPSINKQLSIVEHLNRLKEKTNSLESNYKKKLEALEHLKKSILQKAFAGELLSASASGFSGLEDEQDLEMKDGREVVVETKSECNGGEALKMDKRSGLGVQGAFDFLGEKENRNEKR